MTTGTYVTGDHIRRGKAWFGQAVYSGGGPGIDINCKIANTGDVPLALSLRVSGDEAVINAPPGFSTVLSILSQDIAPLANVVPMRNCHFGVVGPPPFSATCDDPVILPTAVDRVTGAIADWPMTEGAGSVVADVSGVGAAADMALTGDYVWQDSGVRLLDATGRCQTAGLPTKLSDAYLANAMTIDAWVKFDTSGASGVDEHMFGIFGSTPGDDAYNDTSLTCFRRQSGGYNPSVMGYDGSPRIGAGGSSAPAGEFVHLAAVVDGTTLRLYMNGTQVAIRTAGTWVLNPATQTFMVGTTNDPADTRVRGIVAMCAVYDRVLSVGEIQQNRDAGVPVSPPPPLGPGRAIVADPEGYYVPVIDSADGLYLVLPPGRSVIVDSTLGIEAGSYGKLDIVAVQAD